MGDSMKAYVWVSKSKSFSSISYSSYHHSDIKREELEKACKKIHKVRTRMVAVRMVHVLYVRG